MFEQVSEVMTSDVGQPIMAAAAFQAASLLAREVSAVTFRYSSVEPPRKAAAAMIGCPPTGPEDIMNTLPVDDFTQLIK